MINALVITITTGLLPSQKYYCLINTNNTNNIFGYS